MSIYDLHLHSHYSDGDDTLEQLVAQIRQRSIVGFSLTDHNGIWGVADMRRLAMQHGLAYVEGIEVTARYETLDVHILGYSRSFRSDVLSSGLASTRAGYAERIGQMVALCQQAGFPKVTMETVWARRAGQVEPSLISYDVASLLQTEYELAGSAARELTTEGGACYVPYGAWALSPSAAIDLIHQAGGVAVIAHLGIAMNPSTQQSIKRLVRACATAGLDGLEVYHPWHTREVQDMLRAWVVEHRWLCTGGSDWHGAGRYHDEAFGHSGVGEADWKRLLAALP